MAGPAKKDIIDLTTPPPGAADSSDDEEDSSKLDLGAWKPRKHRQASNVSTNKTSIPVDNSKPAVAETRFNDTTLPAPNRLDRLVGPKQTAATRGGRAAATPHVIVSHTEPSRPKSSLISSETAGGQNPLQRPLVASDQVNGKSRQDVLVSHYVKPNPTLLQLSKSSGHANAHYPPHTPVPNPSSISPGAGLEAYQNGNLPPAAAKVSRLAPEVSLGPRNADLMEQPSSKQSPKPPSPSLGNNANVYKGGERPALEEPMPKAPSSQITAQPVQHLLHNQPPERSEPSAPPHASTSLYPPLPVLRNAEHFSSVEKPTSQYPPITPVTTGASRPSVQTSGQPSRSPQVATQPLAGLKRGSEGKILGKNKEPLSDTGAVQSAREGHVKTKASRTILNSAIAGRTFFDHKTALAQSSTRFQPAAVASSQDLPLVSSASFRHTAAPQSGEMAYSQSLYPDAKKNLPSQSPSHAISPQFGMLVPNCLPATAQAASSVLSEFYSPSREAEASLHGPLVPPRSPLNSTSMNLDERDRRVLRLVKQKGNTETMRLFSMLNRDWSVSRADKERWNKEEDDFLAHIKEKLGLPWSQIAQFFPNRPSWHTLQSRYAQKLKMRDNDSPPPTKRIRRLSSSSPSPESLGASSRASSGSREQDNANVSGRRTTRAQGVYKPGIYMQPPPLDSYSQQDEIPRQFMRTQEPHPPSAPPEAPMRRLRRGGPPVPQASNATNKLPECQITIVESPSVQLVRLAEGQAKVDHELALLGRGPRAESQDGTRRYLKRAERLFLSKSLKSSLWDNRVDTQWNRTTLHVGFTDEEILAIEPHVGSVRSIQITPNDLRLEPLARLKLLMPGSTSRQIWHIASAAIKQDALRSRSRHSVEDFLSDCASSEGDEAPNVQQLCVTLAKAARIGVGACTVSSLIRNRELGSLGKFKAPNAVSTSFGPSAYFKGASSDINVVAWAPDGVRFCAGTTCFTDDHDLQYNRENNLFFGDVRTSKLLELPEHMVPRKTKSGSGINSERVMLASQDPWIFKSITAISFTPDNQYMITGGHDGVSRVWDISASKPRCTLAFPEKPPPNIGNDELWIETLTANSKGLFAVGRSHGPDPIRVYRYRLSDSEHTVKKFNANDYKVGKYKPLRPEPQSVKPTILKFGPEAYGQDRYLLCGYGSAHENTKNGELAVWDLETGDKIFNEIGCKTVFDVTWSDSIYGRFAAGCVAGPNVNRGTKSVIRIYDSININGKMKSDDKHNIELECPARDINEMIWHPFDNNLISAACTDGSVYTWDIRRHSEILHKFTHDKTLSVHDALVDLEDADTGVNFISYGPGHRLYTGSSDGIVASWDPHRSTEDAFCQKVAQVQSGVYRGAFSPDQSNLLIGEHSGALSLWSVGLEDRGFDFRQADEFTFIEDTVKKDRIRTSPDYRAVDVLPPDLETGKGAAAALLKQGDIEIRPFGNFPKKQAVQGPRYRESETIDERIIADREYAAKFQAQLRKHEGEPKTSIPNFDDGGGPSVPEIIDDEYDILVDELIDMTVNGGAE